MDSYNEIEKILEKVEISAKTITDYIKNLVKKFESMDGDRKYKIKRIEKEYAAFKACKTFLQNEYLEDA
jgi:predicted transcriptional regulator